MSFFNKVIAFFSAVIMWLFGTGVSVTPVFPEETEPREKAVYDEGEFIMKNGDIVVSADAAGGGNGTVQSPMTFYEAKEALKNNDADVTVWLTGGRYVFDKTVDFTSADGKNVTYRNIPGETVVFTSAVPVTGWINGRVNDVDVLVADIDFPVNTLYSADARLQRSRYPKQGEFVIRANDKNDFCSTASDYFGMNPRFFAESSDLTDFRNVEDVYIRIMHYWKDELLPLSSVNTADGEIKTAKIPSMTVAGGDRYYFENVYEALSEQGEWYIDNKEHKIYYVPFDGETAENTVLYAPQCEELVRLNGCENVSFIGITFTETDFYMRNGINFATVTKEFPDYIKYSGDHPQAAFDILRAVEVSRSENVVFEHCRFVRTGNSALGFGDGSKNCSVCTSEFCDIGGNGVYISGVNDLANDENVTENITVADCHINGYGKVFNNAIGVLLTYARKCSIAQNEIHDGYYTAVSVGWTWGYADCITGENLIENNLLYDIGQGWLSDMGGIYTLGIQDGTVLRGNVIHDVGCYAGDSGYGGWGVYLDEGSTRILVENNLCYNCSSEGFHQHYGMDNLIRNNIFAMNGDAQFRVSRKEDHNSLTLENNILLADGGLIYAELKKNNFTDRNNLFWDLSRKQRVRSSKTSDDAVSHRKGIAAAVSMGYYNDATYADPLFRDARNCDFTLAENSPALDMGFVPWDYSAAGTLTQF